MCYLEFILLIVNPLARSHLNVFLLKDIVNKKYYMGFENTLHLKLNQLV